jgi:hypothetical protein
MDPRFDMASRVEQYFPARSGSTQAPSSSLDAALTLASEALAVAPLVTAEPPSPSARRVSSHLSVDSPVKTLSELTNVDMSPTVEYDMIPIEARERGIPEHDLRAKRLAADLERLDLVLEQENLALEVDAGDVDDLAACLAQQITLLAAVAGDPHLSKCVSDERMKAISAAAQEAIEAMQRAADAMGTTEAALVAVLSASRQQLQDEALPPPPPPPPFGGPSRSSSRSPPSRKPMVVSEPANAIRITVQKGRVIPDTTESSPPSQRDRWVVRS